MTKSTKSPRGVWLLAVAGAVGLLLFLVWPRNGNSDTKPVGVDNPAPDMSLVANPKKPKQRPAPGKRVGGAHMPIMPGVDKAAMREAYAAAAGKSPGQAAFRAMIKKFMEVNAEMARAKAAKEGVTLKEIEELTYFGYMVMTTQSPSAIEALTGKTMSEADKAELGEMMHEHNRRFSLGLKDLVAKGASESERWNHIYQAQQDYKDSLFKLTGLNETTFDDLLAGDLAKTGSPAGTTSYPENGKTKPYTGEPGPRPSGKPVTPLPK